MTLERRQNCGNLVQVRVVVRDKQANWWELLKRGYFCRYEMESWTDWLGCFGVKNCTNTACVSGTGSETQQGDESVGPPRR